MFETYILPIVIFLILGLVAGILLTVASKVFFVKTDERIEQISDAHGCINTEYTSSSKEIVSATLKLYDRIINPKLSVRRMTIAVNHLIKETELKKQNTFEQLDLFSDFETVQKQKQLKQTRLDNERNIQKAVLELKKRYGKNAVLKGMNYFEGATARIRNSQIGGHKA